MAALYIGLDLGTQGVKASVYDHEAKQIVGRGFQAYDIQPTSVPGRAEQDPVTWIEVHPPPALPCCMPPRQARPWHS